MQKKLELAMDVLYELELYIDDNDVCNCDLDYMCPECKIREAVEFLDKLEK